MYQDKNYSYVYKTTNLLNGEFYIGLRSCFCEPKKDKKYLGSGIRIQRSINKYGFENFSKEILVICKQRKEASKYEGELANLETIQNPLCLNLKTGGEYETGVYYSEITKEKISNALKNYYTNEENRIKTSVAIKKAFDTNPEYRKLLSKIRRQICKDPQHIAKVKEIRQKLHKETDINEKIKAGLNKPEVKAKRSLKMKKYASTEKGQIALSKATKNSVYMNNGNETKRVTESKINDYLNNGWIKGSLIPVNDITKEKLSILSKNKIWIKNETLNKNKRVSEEDLENYINNGWSTGIIFKRRVQKFMS